VKVNERGQAFSDTNHMVRVRGGVHIVALDSSHVAEIYPAADSETNIETWQCLVIHVT
jgi:hypothetical protein